MTISLTNTGKRFNRDWIFRHLNFRFESGTSYAITGSNGSGKSTLLQVIAGAISPSQGKVEYYTPDINQHQPTPPENIFQYISIAAPYLELIEEMTLEEFLLFHKEFKPLLPSLSIQKIISVIGLDSARTKQIRYFSSGMKQRVKLAQSFFSDTPVLLLDEPCTNLDAEGVELYLKLYSEYCSGRLVIISSNDPVEYSFCREVIRMAEFKV